MLENKNQIRSHQGTKNREIKGIGKESECHRQLLPRNIESQQN